MMNFTRIPTEFVLLLAIVASGCSSSPATTRATTTQPEPAQTRASQTKTTSATNDAAATTQRLRIKHYMVECEGYQVFHCLLAQKEGSENWFYFYDQIEGFDYQWGSDYEVLIDVQKSNTQLADASKSTYTLIEITTQQQHITSEAFHYVSRNSHERITKLADGQFSLLGNKEFICANDNCANLNSAIAQHQSTVLSFQHSDDPAKPLVLTGVMCSDSNPSFAETCL